MTHVGQELAFGPVGSLSFFRKLLLPGHSLLAFADILNVRDEMKGPILLVAEQ